MTWPMSQDYNEAIQNPARNFTDPDLKRGKVVCNALGLPMPYSGNFADVYQIRCDDGSRWAIKCFTRETPNLRERYAAISRHLQQAKLPFTVDFTWLEQGIRVGGRWYPVLKMQWVEGLTLNQFVAQSLDKPAVLEALLQVWARMGRRLRESDTAHADLQHGNVLLVREGSSLLVKLVDYDGMFVPALAGQASGEVGHPSYQHPKRLVEGTYSLEVDRVPLLVVATALSALKIQGRALWGKYDNGDNLLFTEDDLKATARSALVRDLLGSSDSTTAALASRLVKALQGGVASVPPLDEVMPESGPAPAAASQPQTAAVKATAVAVPVNLRAVPVTRRGHPPRDGGEPSAAGKQTAATNERKRVVPLAGSLAVVAAMGVLGVMAGIIILTIHRLRDTARVAQSPTAPLTAPDNGSPKRTERGGVSSEPSIAREPGRPISTEKDPATTGAGALPQSKPIPGPFGMKFVTVPEGKFWMGGGGGKPGAKPVTVETEFQIGIHEVTQAQWESLMGSNPSFFSRGGTGKEKVKDIADEELRRFPVEMASWVDVQNYIKKLNEKSQESGWLYRLPTEAEWEYACRGGATSNDWSFHFYFDDKLTNDLSSDQANFNGNYPYGNAAKGRYLGRTTKVGSYPPNKLGIYDMHGNVWEWCEDSDDGGEGRVFRDGGWRDHGYRCRASSRSSLGPAYRFGDLGFRLVRVPSR